MLTLTDAHANGTEKEQITTTEFLDHVKTRECGCDIDAVGNNLDDKRRVKTSAEEVLSTVVDCCIVSIDFSQVQMATNK
jgi:hypothetical protein